MNIHDLEAFIAVVETGSIVGASARLNSALADVTRLHLARGLAGGHHAFYTHEAAEADGFRARGL